MLTQGRLDADATSSSPTSVLGIWSAASRRKVADDRRRRTMQTSESGPWVQVSRLGNPLFNEVIVPLGKKDEWNGENPVGRRGVPAERPASRAGRAAAGALPGRVPEPRRRSTAARADLVAILLTGIPNGDRARASRTTPARRYADMLRLNVAIPPTRDAESASASSAATSPGSRTAGASPTTSSTIELRAIAGAHLPARDQLVHAGRRAPRC